MEYYLKNNFGLIFYDFSKMFRNQDSTFTKTTILQVVPVSQFFSAQDSVHGFLTRIQNSIFHILELLKSPSIKDVIWKIIFEIMCMILLKNFEIRIVLYENDLVANGTCHNIAVSLDTRFSSQLDNPTPKRYF